MLKGNGDRRLADYLLGRLGEPEQAEIERRYFEDPDFLERLEMAEEDLIDAYVRGELSIEDRRPFEEHFLRSAARRTKVEVARAFLKSLPPSTRRFPLLALAAAVLVAALGVSLLLRVQQPAPRQSPSAGPAHQLGTLAFTLTPGVTRDGQTGNLLRIPPEIGQLELRLLLQATESYPRYRAALETVEGRTVHRWESVPPGEANQAIPLQIPVEQVAEDDYILMLEGLPPSGESEKLYSYVFRVVKLQAQ